MIQLLENIKSIQYFMIRKLNRPSLLLIYQSLALAPITEYYLIHCRKDNSLFYNNSNYFYNIWQ